MSHDDLTAGGADPLAALAVLDPADHVVRPLARIAERAAQVRRARRARTTVLGAAASVALVASAVVLLPGGPATTSMPAATGTSMSTVPVPPADCSHGTTVFDVGAHPELVHLLGGSGAPPLSSVYGVDLSGAPCDGSGTGGTAAVRARFSADGATVTGGLVVTGPLGDRPWLSDGEENPTPGFTPTEVPAPSSSPDPGDMIRETVSVRGTRAYLYRWPEDSRTLVAGGTGGVEWQEPSTGSWWAVQSAGLSRDELLAVADGLGTSGDRLDQAGLPTDGWMALPVIDGGRRGHRFDANYDDGVNSVTLLVSDVPQYGPELVGLVTPGSVEVADVHGARAFLRPIGLDGDSPSLQWSADGLFFALHAGPDMSFDELVTLARSVVHVPADDPWIARAVATAAPNPYTERPTAAGGTPAPLRSPTLSSSAAPATTTPVDGVTTTVSPAPTDTGTGTSSPATG